MEMGWKFSVYAQNAVEYALKIAEKNEMGSASQKNMEKFRKKLGIGVC
jgi:hypothetical protein